MSFLICVPCPVGSCTSTARSSLLNVAVENGWQRRRGVSSRRLCHRSAADDNFPAVENVEDKKPLLISKSSSPRRSSQEKVQEMVQKQVDLLKKRRVGQNSKRRTNSWDLNEAFDRCIDLAVMQTFLLLFSTSSNHIENFFLSSSVKTALQMLPPREREQVKALIAWSVWVRRTDDLMDGMNGCCATNEVLDRWEQRLFDLYEGRPHDIYDAAMSHALSKFPIDLQLFKDGMEGMRMDIRKTRYESFDELYLYMYHVAATLSISCIQLFGTSSDSKVPLEDVYNGIVAFSVCGQLTDILRDVVEDAANGRIYLPQDELAKAGLSEDDIFGEQVSSEWKSFVKDQIKRARAYADEGDKVLKELTPCCRQIFWAVSEMNRNILDTIEANNYNLTNPTPFRPSKVLQELLTTSVEGK